MTGEVLTDPVVEQPRFQVVGGAPTEEEMAVVAAVLLALTRERPNPHAPSDSTLAGGWKSYWHTVRQPFIPGHEAWRSTFRR